MEIEMLTVKSMPLCKLQMEKSANVGELKKQLAKQVPRLKVSRQSIRDDPKGKDIKDSSTLSSINIKSGKLYVKDLGPQISWSAVFIAEYFGPLVVYSLFAIRPELIYAKTDDGLSCVAKLAWGCWSLHYAKRLLETIFVHRFSHGTMPIRNLFKNCTYYWGFTAYVAYHVNHPLFTDPCSVQVLIGAGIFALSELGNLSIHLLLRDLRPPGTTVRKIPVANKNPFSCLFNYVSCPNYTYEFGAWIGFSLLTNCIPAMLFAAAGMYQMTVWAIGKHKNYRREFSDYPRSRKAIVPFII